MTYSGWIDEEPIEDAGALPHATCGGWRGRGVTRAAAAVVLAVGALTCVTLVTAWAVGGFSRNPASDAQMDVMARRAAQLAADAVGDKNIPADIPVERAATVVFTLPDWLFDPNPISGARRPTAPRVASAPIVAPEPRVDMVRSVPLPTANPLGAARGQAGNAEDAAVNALIDPDGRMASVPLPQRNPLLSGAPSATQPKVAALPPPAVMVPDAPAAAGKSVETLIPLPQPGDKFAIYDIKGRTVYLPSGEKLEAHSGYGDGFDNLSYVSTRMIGPTPPNIYTLTMREALFHGVEALRLRPVGDGKMYGRDGLLTHSYLMGPRGDSNGCVSFKDYDRFLAAFKRGEVTRLIVVANLTNAPSTPDNPLLAWLAGINRQ